MTGEYTYTAKDIIRITGCTKSTIYRRIKEGKKICGVTVEVIRTGGDDDGNIRISKTSYERIERNLGIVR